MKRFVTFFRALGVLLILGAVGTPLLAQEQRISVEMPGIILQNIEKEITITDASRLDVYSDTVMVSLNGVSQPVIVKEGVCTLKYNFPQSETLTIVYEDTTTSVPVCPIPLWTSILPPLIAILMAFILKEVYTSLFTGVLVGATIIAYYQGASAIGAVFIGALRIIDTYVIDTVIDTGHAQVVVFLLLIGSTVAIVSLNGGMKGLVRWLSRFAKTPRSGQLVTFIMDLCIFFDDYANTLVVGSTMRPLAKDLRISKEKLAFIVDSTAAPVGAIALITTWIGAELSYIQEGLNVIGSTESAYGIFIASIPCRFYPLFMLAFVVMVAITGRDYGPMYAAERNAHLGLSTDGSEEKAEVDTEIEPDPSIKAKWYNAVIPIGVLIIVTVIGIFVTGYSPEIWANTEASFGGKLMDTVGAADSYVALLWSSITSTVVAIILTAAQRILSFAKTMEAMMVGFKMMLPAVIVLVLAWTLALMTKHMHTAEFVSRALIEWQISPLFLPAVTFILAGIIAFSTGTSWGTMAILYPLVIPVSWELTASVGMNYDESMHILMNVVSCILAGAVFGDHCSPISDTTIMSSSSTGCNHLAHVRTQVPYALTVAAVALLIGIIPSTLGVPNWISLIAGIGVMWLAIRFFGRNPRLDAEAEMAK